MAKHFNIDFHCHSIMRSTNNAKERNCIDLWAKTLNYRGESVMERWVGIQLSEMTKESQSNLYAYCSGNTKVIIDSFYPIEKGWLNFRAISSMLTSSDMKRNIFRIASGISESRFRELIEHTSYFSELEEQYDVAVSEQGVSFDGKYAYRLARSFDDIKNVAESNNKLIVIPSIEGAHALGCGDIDSKGKSAEQMKMLMTENIGKIKKWEFPPFFIGLAHHFWNQLCGHARSFKHPVNFIVDQGSGLNKGITALGWHVIRELLTRKNGRRILIGIKHMSIKSRVSYYRFILDNNFLNQDDPIPIICSHTGVNGFKSMERMTKFSDSRKLSKHTMFNNWSMNLCGEEIQIIHQTGGIVGVILDKDVLGSSKYLNTIKNEKEPKIRKTMYLKLIWGTVFFMIDSINEKSGWSVPVFSSDFDGLINQIEFYKSAEDIEQLRCDMLNYLEDNNYKQELWFGYSPGQLVEKLFCSNIFTFLEKHYRI
ncbi:MAG: hypothetical protein JKY53_10745 [Flavobacteriales bacterium]|nr:hypothetical protein [Flavobacteriales bacterium]